MRKCPALSTHAQAADVLFFSLSACLSCGSQEVIDRLTSSLTRLADADKMRQIASKFEETIWAEAASHKEYSERIERKPSDESCALNWPAPMSM